MSSVLNQQITSQRITSEEMLGWLIDEHDIPEELGEAVLSAWVGALCYAVLDLVERFEIPLKDLTAEKASLGLSVGLAPNGWKDEHLWAQIAQQTGLSISESRELLETVAAKLESADGELEFVPLGWFRGSNKAGFTIRLRKDFLQPELDDSSFA